MNLYSKWIVPPFSDTVTGTNKQWHSNWYQQTVTQWLVPTNSDNEYQGPGVRPTKRQTQCQLHMPILHNMTALGSSKPLFATMQGKCNWSCQINAHSQLSLPASISNTCNVCMYVCTYTAPKVPQNFPTHLDPLLFFTTVLQLTGCSWEEGGVPGGTGDVQGTEHSNTPKLSTAQYCLYTKVHRWLIDWHQMHLSHFQSSFTAFEFHMCTHRCTHAHTYVPGLLMSTESGISSEFEDPWPSSADSDTHASSGME